MGPSSGGGAPGLMMQPRKKNMENGIDPRLPVTGTKGCEIIGKGIRFERIRRITGYLVGTVDRFNNAKMSELRDRVKHTAFR